MWLAKELGWRLQSLVKTKKQCSGVPASVAARFQGVVPKVRDGGRILWEARVKGQPRRSFASEKAAAQAVARARGCAVKRLLRTSTFTRLRARQVFKASYPVFKKYLPGDLLHTRKHEVQCKQQFKEEFWTFWCSGVGSGLRSGVLEVVMPNTTCLRLLKLVFQRIVWEPCLVLYLSLWLFSAFSGVQVLAGSGSLVGVDARFALYALS